jgi:drug/metabolite transporter (DMT)-like permease
VADEGDAAVVRPAGGGARFAPAALWRLLNDHPAVAGTLGASTIAFSAIFIALADTGEGTAAAFRCIYALPALALLAARERRDFGRRPLRDRRFPLYAGVLFGADLTLWNFSIADVGAGLSTVLGNLQVVIVPLIAFLALGERPERRIIYAIGPSVLGIALISGVLESGAYGDHPVRGTIYGLLTGAAYAFFILLLRQGNVDQRRPAGPLFDATLVGAASAIVMGAAVGALDLVPSWPAHGWLALLAITSQVLGWMLISISLPRLSAALNSLILTIQPVGSVILGVIILGESPTLLQLAGTVLVLSALLAVAIRRTPERRCPEPAC